MLFVLLGGNCQVPILQCDIYIVLIEARQIHFHQVGLIGLADIGFHQRLALVAVEFTIRACRFLVAPFGPSVFREREAKESIKQIIIKNTRE